MMLSLLRLMLAIVALGLSGQDRPLSHGIPCMCAAMDSGLTRHRLACILLGTAVLHPMHVARTFARTLGPSTCRQEMMAFGYVSTWHLVGTKCLKQRPLF